MKDNKLKKKTIAWGLLLFLLNGCAANEEQSVAQVPIRVAAEIASVTSRAPIGEGSVFKTALYRWDYKGDVSWDSWKEYQTTQSECLVEVLAGGSLMIKEWEPLFYVSGYDTSLKAVTPIGDENANVVTFASAQMDGTQDVMVADFTKAGNSSIQFPTLLRFEHQLAQFNFQATKLKTSQVKDVLAVSLKSVALVQHIALCNTENPLGYVDVETLPVVMESPVTLAEESTVKLGQPMMVKAGMTELSFDIEVAKTDNSTITIPVKVTFSEATVAGKSYLITIDFNKVETPEPLEVTATIDAWIQGTGGDATFDDV